MNIFFITVVVVFIVFIVTTIVIVDIIIIVIIVIILINAINASIVVIFITVEMLVIIVMVIIIILLSFSLSLSSLYLLSLSKLLLSLLQGLSLLPIISLLPFIRKISACSSCVIRNVCSYPSRVVLLWIRRESKSTQPIPTKLTNRQKRFSLDYSVSVWLMLRWTEQSSFANCDYCFISSCLNFLQYTLTKIVCVQFTLGYYNLSIILTCIWAHLQQSQSKSQ